MQTVEFTAPIKNGIVHIPAEYQQLNQQTHAKFVVCYEESKSIKTHKMSAASIDTTKYKFNKDEANER